MSRTLKLLPAGLLLLAAGAAQAAGPDLGQVDKQPLNVIAISLFLAFVALTLGITYWAARRTKSTADFYAAGGGITGWQNGFAIAGDYMSAASFLGIAALVYANGYDGLIYSIGFLVGWPIIMFLMAERLRNLGKLSPSADVVSFRMSADADADRCRQRGTLVVVAFYLIAQMVGAGQLIQLLFGLPYLYADHHRRRVDDLLRHVRRHAGDDLGADHQGRVAARRGQLHGVDAVLQRRWAGACSRAVRQGGRSVAS